jgi:hypothetical protein
VADSGTFEDGYRSGWEGVAGKAPLPSSRTRPPEGEPTDYEAGFRYGRADALEQFQPGATPRQRAKALLPSDTAEPPQARAASRRERHLAELEKSQADLRKSIAETDRLVAESDKMIRRHHKECDDDTP